MSGEEILSIEQVNAITGDDITYWLGNQFMTPDLLADKVCWWMTTALSTPVPSEATEAGEGERWTGEPCPNGERCPNCTREVVQCSDGCPTCDDWYATYWPDIKRTPDEPDAGEALALAQHIYEASACYEEDGTGWESQHGAPRREATAQARAVLASPWLAALLAVERGKALREAADDWRQGEWLALTSKVKPGGPSSIIGAGQVVTDWLRDRADREATS